MKFQLTPVAALLLILAASNAQEAGASTYNVDAGILSSRLSSDDQTAMGTWAMGATVYTTPVRLDPSQPFAELDFLQRANQFTLMYSSYSFSGSQVISDTTATDLMVSGLVHFDQLALGLSHSSGTMKLSPVGVSWVGYDVSTSSTTFRMGYRARPQTELNLSIGQSVDAYSGSIGLPAISDDRLSWNKLSIHHVALLNPERSLVFDLGMKRKDRSQGSASSSTQVLDAQLRAYPSPTFYVEAGLNEESGDPSGSTGRTVSYGAGASLTHRLVLQVFGSKFTAADPRRFSSDRELGFALSLRF